MRTAKADSRRFLSPEMLKKMAHLNIKSRSVVEGSVTGAHRSPFKGFSTEFADHREYAKGDDLRHLDWRVYARSERYYIKQFEENTNLKMYMLMDCSASMGYASNGISKYEYACHLAAGLSYLVIRQQDAAGLAIFDTKIQNYFPPKGTVSHLRAMLDALVDLRPSQGTDTGIVLHGIAEMLKRRGLIVIVSDLMDDPETVIKGLAHFRQKRHDVIVLHVLDDYELNFPFEKVGEFLDMETGEKIRVAPKEIKEEYKKEITGFLERYKSACFENAIDYVTINTKIPPDVFLSAYLTRRAKMT
ncbi:MAG TPA: DUF58 domain-containing protein [Planctomycetota bacterium]|nr:DUF58 domain-containing protein [Planctomycetota bacterium]